MNQPPSWDIDGVFAGGVAGAPWRDAASAAEQRVEALRRRADSLADPGEDPEAWERLLLELEELELDIHELSTIAYCAASAHTADRLAQAAEVRAEDLWTRLERARVPVRDGLARCDDDAFATLARRPGLRGQRPELEEIRRTAHLLLPREQAALASELSRDGIHAWGTLYDRASARVRIRLPDGRELSAGQAWNLMSSPDPELRGAIHAAAGAAWREQRDLFAATLSHITGTRQVIDDRRGVDELADTLAECRMERSTLDAMSAAIRSFRPVLASWLLDKARLLGMERLRWEDIAAPVGGKPPPHPWRLSAAFVVEQLGRFDRSLADFAQKALDRRWIEAEDRPDKRQGGWCARLPRSGQSRIFMTHGGELRSTVTLAHELGHAWHNHITMDLPPARRRIPMTLAETASTFAENVVRDAALEAATDPAARLQLLDARLQAGVSFLMNIPARFAFERAVHRMRREGELDPDRLDREMVACQQEAYDGALASWDPTFWASKLHFHISQVAFYNFPYSFGYLFSSLVHQRALREGSSWLPVLVELLRRTGWDSAETLARDVLGVELDDASTWRAAMDPLERDLAAWRELAQIPS